MRVEGGTCDVLIDALLRDSLGDYLRHEAVRLALATHFHLDDWDAGASASPSGSDFRTPRSSR